MAIALGIMAGIIFLTYSLYFSRIIKGNPQEFELDMVRAMGTWIMVRGVASRKSLWLLLLISIIFEVVYFGLTLLTINNVILLFLTGLLVGLEGCHLLIISLNLSKFFKAKITLKDLFNWRLERISAIMFFTHSFLVLVFLIAY